MSLNAWKTWAIGDVLTAADMNGYNRDNGRWLSHNATGGAPLARMSNSVTQSGFTSGNLVTLDTTIFSAGSFSTIATGGGTALSIPVGGTGKYLCGASTQALCTYGAGNANVITSLVKNAATRIAQADVASNFTATHFMTVSALYSVVNGDSIGAIVDFNAYSPVDVVHVADRSPELWAIWIGE